MKNKKLIVLCGIPASGKSTWAKRYKETHYNSIWVSRDNIRYSLLEKNDDYFAKEEDVYRKFCQAIIDGLITFDIIIADATHLNKWSRRKLIDSINLISNYNIEYDLIGINFNISIDECLERNEKRAGRERVPEHVIKNMNKKFEPISLKTDKDFKLIINF